MEHRIAVIDDELCKPKKCNLECINFCPVNKSGGKCIVLGEYGNNQIAVIDEDLCNGCGICVKKCPYDAITIVNLSHELGEVKMHQYGINSFRLYKLPTPKKGSVIGLLGRNGMGKTTIVNILSGSIKPNIGSYENEPNWEDILKFFQGTELKSHFEKVSNNNIKASIKPQKVYLIPKVFNGTTRELLEKHDERNTVTELTEQLDLKNSLEKNVNELSGGELQRLAVAITANKEADFYFFDEPSSYNDIYQRLSVARVIHRLADIGKSVMVVEHDITLLDYLSDYIYALYGEPGVYGIVSSVLSTKVGINVFLDGYLPNENVRFRDKAFRFETSTSKEDFIQNEVLTEYSDLEKYYNTFKLKVTTGKIRKGEVVGIVGANALGKTTMMKMLAGVEKPDNGKVDMNTKISYKPQYLNQEYDGDVRSLFDTAYGKPIEGTSIEEQIIFQIGVKKLYDRMIKNLSGGELQKVAVVACLLREADIYALDEPSAFLDVEDRIALAKFIQRFVMTQGKSAIIIDHDLQLIDLVADTLIVFVGKPSVEGYTTETLEKTMGMNVFLQGLELTYRRDPDSNRPRVNKIESRLDRIQKESKNYYLTK
ncbi:MAG: ribosome biogenesis/translation initiation ATPase RLI [Thaumarchaeota archaeon]|nr:ribosome biogenesis/translation initiation ATPase RLI [Nitrososphaerota archaeon]|tara:strand:- start:2402 stop:4192 length:1791 start_codon:yes stop_codon:yes gene_type:complete